jgi:hypothetical protein
MQKEGPTHSSSHAARPLRPFRRQELEVLEEDAPVFKLIGPVSASSVPHSCSAQCVHGICGTDSLNQIPLPPLHTLASTGACEAGAHGGAE